MARPRTPLAVARLTGQDKKNPQRFANRADPVVGPLGGPPAYLSDAEAAAWHSFSAEWSWLTEADRAAMVPLCKIRVKVEDPKENLTASMLSEYRLQISAFGGTPTTRSKVHCAPDTDDHDPFAKFDT